jgi:hypothetical protein
MAAGPCQVRRRHPLSCSKGQVIALLPVDRRWVAIPHLDHSRSWKGPLDPPQVAPEAPDQHRYLGERPDLAPTGDVVRFDLGAHDADDLPARRQDALPDFGCQWLSTALGRSPIERQPGPAHAPGLGADVGLLVRSYGGIQLGLLCVELDPQGIAHQQPQPAHSPLALHLPGDRVDAIENGFDHQLGRRPARKKPASEVKA